jgi:hypothetical protein
MAKTVAQVDIEVQELRADVQALQQHPEPVGIPALVTQVMSGVGVVGKDHRNPQHNYTFRSIDDVVNQLQPALVEAGVVLGSEVVATATEQYTTGKGTVMRWAMVHMRYTLHGPLGDYLVAEGVGEAADASDKAHMKAMQQAYKYALLQVLAIPTGEPDADADSPEGRGNGGHGDFTNWAKAKVLELAGGDTDLASTLWAAAEPGDGPLTEAEALAVYGKAKANHEQAAADLEGES